MSFPMPARPSQGEAWFRSFEARPEVERAPFLKSLVNSTPPTFEEEWLDFKGAEKLDILGQKAQEIWSTALSGFANTGGGIIVWGIDAREDKESKVDYANGLSLAPNPAALISRLKRLQAQAADPPVQGVEYRQCSDRADGGKGFVVCYIPESRFKPHRAEHCQKGFYIRVGDNFVQPPVALLRSMFYPQTHSRLWIEMTATSFDQLPDGVLLSIEGRLHNTGTATASNVFLVVQSSAEGGTWHRAGRWEERGTPQGRAGYECPGHPVHPGQVERVFVFTQKVSHAQAITFRVLMYAQDMEPLETTISFSREQLEDKVAIKGVSQSVTWHKEV